MGATDAENETSTPRLSGSCPTTSGYGGSSKLAEAEMDPSLMLESGHSDGGGGVTISVGGGVNVSEVSSAI